MDKKPDKTEERENKPTEKAQQEKSLEKLGAIPKKLYDKKGKDSKSACKNNKGQAASDGPDSTVEEYFSDDEEMELSESQHHQLLKKQRAVKVTYEFAQGPTTSAEEQSEGATADPVVPEDEYFEPSELCLMLETRCLVFKGMFDKHVTEEERQTIDELYSGRNLKVVISKSAASVHLCNRSQVWMELWWGVPLLVLSMEYDTPELWIIIAERSTGLLLCKDTISWRSGYTRESTTYHVMEICNKHSSKMALNFETEDAAADFSLNVSLFLSKLENMNVCPAKCCVNKWLENSSEEDKRCTPCCLFQLLIMSEEDYHRYLAYHRYFEPRVLNRGGFGGDW